MRGVVKLIGGYYYAEVRCWRDMGVAITVTALLTAALASCAAPQHSAVQLAAAQLALVLLRSKLHSK